MSDFNLGEYITNHENWETGAGYVLIRRLPSKVMTDGGLVLPKQAQEHSVFYIIVAAGPNAIPGEWWRAKQIGIEPPPPLEPGDVVTGIGSVMEQHPIGFKEDGKPIELYNSLASSMSLVCRIPAQHKESAHAQSRST